MSEAEILALVSKIIAEVPEAVEGLGNVASRLLEGHPEAAAREARLVAETVGIKRAGAAAYDAKR